MNKAIFFDRDGVLNIDTINLHKIEEWKWINGAKDAIKFCNDNGYLAIIVTNQSGIARGFFTFNDVNRVHNFVQGELYKIGARIDAFYICPHVDDGTGTVEKYSIECNCRKPKPGLILQACKDFDIDVKQSYMVGDKQRDCDAGINAGCKGTCLFDGVDLLKSVKEMLQDG